MDLTQEQVNAVLAALRPHFNPEGLVHFDLAVTRLNMAGLQQQLSEARANGKVEVGPNGDVAALMAARES
jgi:hypothetical protein